MKTNRRDFIKKSAIASLSILPATNAIAKEVENHQRLEEFINKSFNSNANFSLIDNNLLNLHFYFTNVKRKGDYLYPSSRSNYKDSFMVVRLPQMHISENAFSFNESRTELKPRMSGFSYLAFQMWPKSSTKKLKFTIENILDWNNDNVFNLVTINDWLKLTNVKDFQFTSYEDIESKVINKEVIDPYFDYIKKVKKFLGTEKNVPITMLELPEGVCLSPLKRVKDKDARFVFGENKLTNFKKGKRGKVNKQYEIWNNSFQYRVPLKGLENIEGVNSNKFEIGNPSFRIVGIVKHKDDISETATIKCDEDKKQNLDNKSGDVKYVLSFLNKKELAFLTQYAKSQKEDHTSEDFDIRESNGMLFTGLGAITHLKYYNLDKLPNKIDLIEFEYKILQGRSIFIKVAHLGYNTKTGQRYKHVKEGTRKIDKSKDSYIEYKEYCECIDRNINYVNSSSRPNNGKSKVENYINIKKPTNPIFQNLTNNCDFKRLPFKKLKTIENERIPIRVLKNEILDPNDCINYEKLNNWFWPIREDITTDINEPTNSIPDGTNAKKIELNQYYHCQFEAEDWEGNIITGSTPFMFIRKSIIANQSQVDNNGKTIIENIYENYFKVVNKNKIFNDRRKTFFNKQKIVFNPTSNVDFVLENKDLIKGFLSLLQEKITPELEDRDFSLLSEIKKEIYNLLENKISELDRAKEKDILENKIPELDQAKDINKLLYTDIKNDFENLFKQLLSEEYKILKIFKASNDKYKFFIEKKAENKTNHLETEFIESYFNIREFKSGTSERIANVPYVVYPQTLKAGVFLDHIKDITNKEIKSVIQYHDDYINYGFNSYTDQDNKGNPIEIEGNGAKVILRNTEAFIKNKEEVENNFYNKIEEALDEAKRLTGNLVASNTVYDTLSLTKLGLTLPKDTLGAINKGTIKLDEQLKEIQNINPKELLRGKLKNVCGLDLTLLLDEYLDNNENTPIHEVSKGIAVVGKEIANSDFYISFKDKIEEADNFIKKYERDYNYFLKNIEDYRLEYNNAIKELSKEIPNANDVKNILNAEFEKAKTEAFNYLEKVTDEYDVDVYAEKLIAQNKKINAFINKKLADVFFNLIKSYENFNKFYCDFGKNILEVNNNNVYEEILSKAGIKDDPLEKIFKVKEDIANDCGFKVEDGFLKKIKDDFDEVLGVENIQDVKDLSFEKFKEKIDAEILNKFTDLSQSNNILIEFEKNTFRILIGEKNNKIEYSTIRTINTTKAGLKQLEKIIADVELIVANNINNTNENVVAAVKKLSSKLLDLKEEKSKKIKAFVFNKIEQNFKLIIDEFAKLEQTVNDNFSSIEDDLKPKYYQLKTNLTLIKNSINSINTVLDVISEINPNKYFKQQEFLETSINEILSRFKNQITIEGFLDSYREEIKKKVEKIFKIIKTEEDKFIYDIEYLKYLYDKNIKKKELEEFVNREIKSFNKKKDEYEKFYKNEVEEILISVEKSIDDYFKNSEISKKYDEYKKVVNTFEAKLIEEKKKLKSLVDNENLKYKNAKKAIEQGIENAIINYKEDYKDEIQKVKEAERIYLFLTTLKKKELVYKWDTNQFRDANFGFITFNKQSNPNTNLSIDVKSVTHFKEGVFPPQIDRIETNAINKFQNFKIGVFKSLFVDFEEVSFVNATGKKSKFDVKIRDIKFEGILSFVEVLEQYLSSIIPGVQVNIYHDHLKLTYSFFVDKIGSPSFSFINVSINFDFRVYFDNRPLRLGFSIGEKNKKFGLSVGAYAGFGYFNIVVNPKDGIVILETALEGAAHVDVRLGPIKGHVSTGFGFFYRKDPNGVILQGYFFLDGSFRAWIISVNLNVSLGIRSVYGNVDAFGTVKVSGKVGLIKKSYRRSYKKTMKKSSTSTNQSNKEVFLEFAESASKLLKQGNIKKKNNKKEEILELLLNDIEEKNNTKDNEYEFQLNEDNWNAFIGLNKKDN